MKNISKKLALLLMCFIFLFNTCSFAAEQEVIADEITTMTLDEAVEYALIHNANVVDLNRMVKDQDDLYKDAKDTYRYWKNKLKSGGYSYETELDYLDCWGHSLELAELSYKSFLSSKGATEETIGYTIKNLAYSVDEMEKAINLLEKTIQKQENDVKIAEVKNSLNMITILDVESAKQTLNSTKLQLESLTPTINTLKTSLKNLMGFEVEKELEIVLPEIEMVILDVPNLSEAIENSLDSNGKAISAKISYKQKEMNNIVATKTSFWTRDQIRDARKEFSDAELRLNNSISVIKNDLLSLYTKVKNSEESAILAKNEYEQLQIKYNQMNVMYELGMISRHDFNSYEIALINAQNTYETKLHENILLNDRWQIALKFGDVLAEEVKQ